MKKNPISIKKSKQSHTANTKFGMGDHYGTGVKQPLGKMRDGVGMKQLKPSKLKTPPKSVV